jgi:hypothetical protein
MQAGSSSTTRWSFSTSPIRSSSRAAATGNGLHSADRLDLLTPTGQRTFTVRGLLEPQGIARAYGGNLIVMDLPAAQAAFLQPGFVNRVDVVVQRTARVDDVATAIARVLPPGLKVDAPGQRKADLHRVMESLQLMLDAVSVTGMAAALLIIFNRLTTVFETRAWQLGVLRALGVRSAALWRELLKESLLLGIAGTAVGIPFGIAAGRILLPVVATTAALNFKLIAADAALAPGLGAFLAAAAVGPLVAVLAAALPAWRISRLPPVESIRGSFGAATVAHSDWIHARSSVSRWAVHWPRSTRPTRRCGIDCHRRHRAGDGVGGAAAAGGVPIPPSSASRAPSSDRPPGWRAAARPQQSPRRADRRHGSVGIGRSSTRMLAYSFEASLVDARPALRWHRWRRRTRCTVMWKRRSTNGWSATSLASAAFTPPSVSAWSTGSMRVARSRSMRSIRTTSRPRCLAAGRSWVRRRRMSGRLCTPGRRC